MMGLQADLRDASDVMVEFAKRGGPVFGQDDNAGATGASSGGSTTTRYLLAGRSHIALSSGCELFLKYVTRASLETPNFRECRAHVLERGERFAEFSTQARDRIAVVGSPFVREGSVVLTHGRSKVVEALLLRAALVEKKRFRVMVLEGRPDAGGAKSARTYANVSCRSSLCPLMCCFYLLTTSISFNNLNWLGWDTHHSRFGFGNGIHNGTCRFGNSRRRGSRREWRDGK